MYIDTSLLVAYYCPEPISEQVESLLRSQASPLVSELAEVELTSAIARKVRDGGLPRADALRLIAEFSAHLDANLFARIRIETTHYRLAKDWLSQLEWPLRTLDALHAAAASLAHVPLATADRRLSSIAASLGIDTLLVSPRG